MTEWLAELLSAERLPVGLLVGLGLASLGLMVVSIALVPRLLARAPADFLVAPPRGPRWARWLRNLAGLCLLLAGLAMLVLPGQGLLTLLASLLLLDFPGRRRLFRWLLARPRVRALVDRWRAAAGRAPLILEGGRDSRGGGPGLPPPC